MIRRDTAAAVCSLVSLLLTAGCGTSGREVRDVPSGVTSPPPASSTTAPPVTAPDVFSISSPVVPPAGELPTTYTCQGSDISPPFDWSSVPGGTVELALVVTDPVDDFAVHWLVTGIDPASTGVGENALPPGGIAGPNSAGGVGWVGPCPATGEVVQLEVTLFALTEPAAITGSMTASDARDLLDFAPSSRTVMTAQATGD